MPICPSIAFVKKKLNSTAVHLAVSNTTVPGQRSHRGYETILASDTIQGCTKQCGWFVITLVNKHRPWQIAVGRLVSTNKW